MAATISGTGHVVTLSATNDKVDSTVTGVETNKVRIKKIRWVGATTAGHTFVLKDASGTDIIYRDVASGANYVGQADFNPPLVSNAGVIAATLASGTVDLYLE